MSTVVQAKNCVYFRWADLSINPGPSGENNNATYGPQVVLIPDGAVGVSITASGLWRDGSGGTWTDPSGGSLAFQQTNSSYQAAAYNSTNISRTYHRENMLIGFWSNGNSSSGSLTGLLNISTSDSKQWWDFHVR